MEARLRRYLQEEEDKELAAFILKRGARRRQRGGKTTRGGDGDSDDSNSDGEEGESEAESDQGRKVVVVKGCEDEAYEKGPAAEEAFFRFQVGVLLSRWLWVGNGGHDMILGDGSIDW